MPARLSTSPAILPLVCSVAMTEVSLSHVNCDVGGRTEVFGPLDVNLVERGPAGARAGEFPRSDVGGRVGTIAGSVNGTAEAPTRQQAIDVIASFAGSVFRALVDSDSFTGIWPPGGPWDTTSSALWPRGSPTPSWLPRGRTSPASPRELETGRADNPVRMHLLAAGEGHTSRTRSG